MMDDAAQIPQQVDPAPSKACVDAKSLRPSESPADPVSKVLDDDDLLIEIIVRLGFPTSLVRAALVCKRWFHNASNPFFLRQFRKLHPPRLLGFYVDNLSTEPHFVSIVPQPPELASVIRRASFGVRNSIMDIRNGIVSVDSYNPATGDDCLSCYPLCPKRGMYSFSFPCHQIEEGNIKVVRSLLVNEEGGSFSHCYVVIESKNEGKNSIVHVYTLQDDVWCMHTTAVIEVPCQQKRKPLLAGNKIYILALSSDIIVLDLMTMGFSTFKIPQELAIIGEGKETLLSRTGDHSSVYLIHVNELKLCIWLHKGDTCVLVDTICLREMLSRLKVSDDTLKDEHNTTLRLSQVGDNAEFVLLKTGRSVLYVDIKCRTLRKVYVMTSTDRIFRRLHPLTMIWPPKLPALKDDTARFAF